MKNNEPVGQIDRKRAHAYLFEWNSFPRPTTVTDAVRVSQPTIKAWHRHGNLKIIWRGTYALDGQRWPRLGQEAELFKDDTVHSGNDTFLYSVLVAVAMAR